MLYFRSAGTRIAALGALIALGAAPSYAAFNINITFAGTPTQSQQNTFLAAKATWESLVTGYITPTATTAIPSLNILATIRAIDGSGGILGQAGPTTIINDGTYVLPTAGSMEFDSADVANLESSGTFNAVILHEMAHVMGLGTLWTDNGVYVNDTGRYTGANALAAYQFEFSQPAATYVPVELGGGSGTRNGHWAEVNPNTSNIFDLQGRPLTQELMTGFIGTQNYISSMTVQSFRDIGYTTVPSVVPESGTAGLLALGITGLVGIVIGRRK